MLFEDNQYKLKKNYMFNDKTPDLKAPRYRPNVENSTSNNNIKKLKTEIKTSIDYSISDIKNIIKTFNEILWSYVITTRDGISLPEQLGDIFIGTCPPKKLSKNVDYKNTQKYNEIVQHRNWESDRYLAKIFYTTYNMNRTFKNADVWGFKAARNFSRAVSKAYPKMWKIYHQVEPGRKIADIYKSFKIKDKQEIAFESLILTYNEFEF